MFAWLVFGTFFLADANAKWYWWIAWVAGALLDYMEVRREARRNRAILVR